MTYVHWGKKAVGQPGREWGEAGHTESRRCNAPLKQLKRCHVTELQACHFVIDLVWVTHALETGVTSAPREGKIDKSI